MYKSNGRGKAAVPRVCFELPRSPSAFVDQFRRYYGPTMNAFGAAEKSGKAESLTKDLVDLFEAQNQSLARGTSTIPATYSRVTVIR